MLAAHPSTAMKSDEEWAKDIRRSVQHLSAQNRSVCFHLGDKRVKGVLKKGDDIMVLVGGFFETNLFGDGKEAMYSSNLRNQ